MESITRRGNGVSDIRSCRWALFALFLVVLLEVVKVESVEQINAAGSQATEEHTTLDEEMLTGTQSAPAAELQRQLKHVYADVTKPTSAEEVGSEDVKEEDIEKLLHGFEEFEASISHVTTSSEEKGSIPKIYSKAAEVGSEKLQELPEVIVNDVKALEAAAEKGEGLTQLLRLVEDENELVRSEKGEGLSELEILHQHLESMKKARSEGSDVSDQLDKIQQDLAAVGELSHLGVSPRMLWWSIASLWHHYSADTIREANRRMRNSLFRRLLEAGVDCYFLSDPSVKTVDNPSSTSHHFCDDDMFCVLAESQDAIATCKLAAADLDLQTATLAQTVEQCQRMVYSLGLCQLPTSAAAFLSL